MAKTLQGKKIVVVGGSSGIGYSVAKAALKEGAGHVLVASSSSQRVVGAVARLRDECGFAQDETERVSGGVLDLTDTNAVREFFKVTGPVDHLVCTSGGSARFGFQGINLDESKDLFDLKFWGSAAAAQTAQIREGGSIIFTTGGSLLKPQPGWTLVVGMLGSVDALTRGLAIDLAPIRVNSVSPGIVDTELWASVPAEAKDKMFQDLEKKLPLRHIASPDEIADAYIFLMKCTYITGQRLDVDGGYQLL